MFSLTARLRSAKLGVQLPASQAVIETLIPVVTAGVDLLVLEGTDDDSADEMTLRQIRDRLIHTQLLLGTTNLQAAQAAASDVVYVERPRWWQRIHRPHNWSLVGRGIRDLRALNDDKPSFNFLVLPHGASTSSQILSTLEQTHPTFVEGSVPWFVDVDPGEADEFIEAGARRLWLSGQALTEPAELPATVAELAGKLRRAWKADPKAAKSYFGA